MDISMLARIFGGGQVYGEETEITDPVALAAFKACHAIHMKYSERAVELQRSLDKRKDEQLQLLKQDPVIKLLTEEAEILTEHMNEQVRKCQKQVDQIKARMVDRTAFLFPDSEQIMADFNKAIDQMSEEHDAEVRALRADLIRLYPEIDNEEAQMRYDEETDRCFFRVPVETTVKPSVN